MIIVDVLLALSLAALFASVLSVTMTQAKHIFDLAKERAIVAEVAEAAEKDWEVGYEVASPVVLVSPRPFCSSDFFAASTTSISLPISSSIPLTHLEVRNNIAYVSTDSSVSADPDLFIVDIHNPSSPTVLSSINTGPGIASFALVGKRIFAAAASTAAQLHVVDLSTRASPVLAKKYQLPLTHATATPPYATAISFDAVGNGDGGSGDVGPRIYLGTEKWDGNEFATIDISNPVAPIWRSGLKIDSKVNDIFASPAGAYIATAGQSQLIGAGSSFSPSGWSRQEGKVVSMYENSESGSDLVFGRTSGGYDIATDYELFLLATSTGTIFAKDSKNISGGVYGIVQDISHIFVATRQSGKEIQIFDKVRSATSSTTNTPAVGMNLSSVINLPTQPQSLTCDRDSLYVLSHTSPNIYVLTH